jgi:hypothetical protein
VHTTSGIVTDHQVLQELYSEVRPFQSAQLGIYWKGPIALANGLKVETLVVSDNEHRGHFLVRLRDAPEALVALNDELATTAFPSARSALVNTERACNRSLFQHMHSGRETR